MINDVVCAGWRRSAGVYVDIKNVLKITHYFNLYSLSSLYAQISPSKRKGERAKKPNKREYRIPIFFAEPFVGYKADTQRPTSVADLKRKYLNYNTIKCKRTRVTQYCTQYIRPLAGRVPSSRPFVSYKRIFFYQSILSSVAFLSRLPRPSKEQRQSFFKYCVF